MKIGDSMYRTEFTLGGDAVLYTGVLIEREDPPGRFPRGVIRVTGRPGGAPSRLNVALNEPPEQDGWCAWFDRRPETMRWYSTVDAAITAAVKIERREHQEAAQTASHHARREWKLEVLRRELEKK